MKKGTSIFCGFFVASLLAAPIGVYANGRSDFDIPLKESTFSGGFEFGNAVIHNSGNTYLGAPGMNLEGYSFEDGGNVGVFIHSAFLFPVIGDESWEGQWSTLCGPAFRVPLSDTLTLQTGFGLSLAGYYERYEDTVLEKEYTRSLFNVGIGADAGLKFDITDTFFVKGGVNIAWAFVGWNNVREGGGWSRDRGDTERTPNGHWGLNANPYVSFGTNFYQPKQHFERPVYERSRPGKPPRKEPSQ